MCKNSFTCYDSNLVYFFYSKMTIGKVFYPGTYLQLVIILSRTPEVGRSTNCNVYFLHLIHTIWSYFTFCMDANCIIKIYVAQEISDIWTIEGL